jgi:hypothetical protein
MRTQEGAFVLDDLSVRCGSGLFSTFWSEVTGSVSPSPRPFLIHDEGSDELASVWTTEPTGFDMKSLS